MSSTQKLDRTSVHAKLRSRTSNLLRQREENFENFFLDLYDISEDFRNAIDDPKLPTIEPQPLLSDPDEVSEDSQNPIGKSNLPLVNTLFTYTMHSLTHILLGWEQQRLFDEESFPDLSKDFSILVNLCRIIYTEYETYVTLVKLADKKKPHCKTPHLVFGERTFRLVTQFQIKRGKIQKLKTNIKQEPQGLEYSCDEMEIQDFNLPSIGSKTHLNPLFAYTSRYTPTLVKYTDGEHNRKLFVSLPEYLDPTTFKVFSRLLTRIHHDFYQTTHIGRPKDKTWKLERMRECLERLDKENLTDNEISIRLADEMEKIDEILTPNTIKRWYLPLLKTEVTTKSS